MAVGWWLLVVGCWLAGWLAGWLVGWLAGWLDGWLAGWQAGWPAVLLSQNTVSRLHIQAMILATAQRPQGGHDARAVFSQSFEEVVSDL